MSEKFKGIWRKVKDGISLTKDLIPTMLQAVLFFTVMLLILAVIEGGIASVCWNMAMPVMFGFKEITMFQAYVLTFTILCLRSNYFSVAKSEYEKLKKKIFDITNEEKVAKIVSIVVVAGFELILILIGIWATMYSWNNILPQMLNMKLIQINFGQAFAFACLFNRFFSRSDNKKTKDDENNESRDMPETEDDRND